MEHAFGVCDICRVPAGEVEGDDFIAAFKIFVGGGEVGGVVAGEVEVFLIFVDEGYVEAAAQGGRGVLEFVGGGCFHGIVWRAGVKTD